MPHLGSFALDSQAPCSEGEGVWPRFPDGKARPSDCFFIRSSQSLLALVEMLHVQHLLEGLGMEAMSAQAVNLQGAHDRAVTHNIVFNASLPHGHSAECPFTRIDCHLRSRQQHTYMGLFLGCIAG
eukprot:528908-Amphidinium_carterae.1